MSEHNDRMPHNQTNQLSQNETVPDTMGSSSESSSTDQSAYHEPTSVNMTDPASPLESHHGSVSSGAPSQTNGLSVAGLVCGIVGVIMSFIPIVNFLLGSVLGILAVVFGAIAKKRDGSGMAGLVLGVITLVVILLWVIVLLVFLAFVSEMDSSTF